ncbi:serine/threonine-protein kinase [Streptomyces sp. NPDC007369]|uniref:serine/threonine-protein kinase n=1 Tax=Streptomyces sp. NPDC007369 TaxID=3154589 RepID=UPI003403F531
MQTLGPDDPTHVGGYRLTGRLGEGGMGKVYQGRSPGGRLVAVKLARPELAADPGFRSRFRSEVEAARRVGGFHTAQVVDADPDGDPPWMVTAFVPGSPLDVVIAEGGPMDERGLRELGAALAEALLAIHSCDLVHRDLKPSNIIMSDDGPRVLDFGIARALNETRLTHTSMVVGTPGFLAPEQIGGRVIAPACDVFALGAVLVYAAGGRAFGEGSPMGLMYRAVHDDPDLSAVPGALRPLVSECLAKDPDARPAAQHLLRALAPASDGQGPDTASEAPAVAAAGPGVAATAVEPAAATSPVDRPQALAPTRPATGPGGLRAVTFGTPLTTRVGTVLPLILFGAGTFGWLGHGLSTGGLPGLAWLSAVPALFSLLAVLVAVAGGRNAVSLDSEGVTITAGTFFGTKSDRVPWEHVAAADVTVGEQPFALLKLALYDDAPLPFGAAGDPLPAPTVDVQLPKRMVNLDPVGALRGPDGSGPRAVARFALEVIGRFAPETLPDGAVPARPAPRNATGHGVTPGRGAAEHLLTHLEFTRPRGRLIAAAVGWLFLAACCGGMTYYVFGAENVPDSSVSYVLGMASVVGLGLSIGKALVPNRLTVTFDAEGISVHGLEKTGAAPATQLIPWRDVAALTAPDSSDGFDFEIEVRVKEGKPLPRPQRGLVPKEPDRLRLTVPGSSTGPTELQRRRIAAVVRHFAPDVHTDYL